MDDTLTGPDNFPLTQSDPLFNSHQQLNEFLSIQSKDLERFVPDPKWKKLPKRQTIDLIQAVLVRFTWLRENDAKLTDAHLARLKLIKLLRLLYKRKLPCTAADLRTMLDLTVPLLDSIAPDGPVDYVMEYYKDNELTPQLCESLRTFQGNLIEQGSVSSMQSLRQRLHMLLWMDEWDELNPAHCWSESIRRDFRAMSPERKQKWRPLLKHLKGNAPVHMPAGWAREAEIYLQAVGVDDFVAQLQLWFAPFRSGHPLPLSVAGSHVLKGLIWYAAVSKDERARDYSLWLLDVKWKQKRNMTKSMIALEVFGITKEELLSRDLIKPEQQTSSRILQRLTEVLSYPNTYTHIVSDPDGEMIIVQGQLHFYRLFRSTGRIERASDNKEIELDWSAIPDQMRLYLHQTCDSPEQLQLRATLLMYDSLYLKLFRAI